MITKGEIEQKSKELEVNTSNVQRDYVFGWLLAGIYTASELRDILILKGGNSLRKAYFEHTRFSSDLDFSTQSAIDETFLRGELNKVCGFAQEMSGVVFETEDTRVETKRQIDKDRLVYEGRLYFHDFYGKASIVISVRMDVTQFDRIYLPVQRRYLIHPYSDQKECRAEITCLKLEESLAAKLKCLIQRRHLADLYDYVFAIFINQELEVSQAEIVTTFLKKTIFEPSPGAARNLLLNIPFDVFRDVWQRYIICPRQSVIDFGEAVASFRKNIEDAFSSFPNRYAEMAFFPAHLRNPIMQAGSSMTLLKMTYDGVPRLVEPYSLAFKRRRDGVGQEYLYVYDQTGGRTSGPGIKCLLNTGIQAIENTSEKFEPRWTVEISKAGELGDSTYFSGGGFGGIRHLSAPIRSKRSAAYSGTVYVVECGYCRRKFERKTRGLVLRPHKDSYGNRCFGRRGSLVGQK